MKKRWLLFCLVLALSSALSARPKVAVVLSGGGAKGIAEIGVLEALEQRGVPIDMVLGTSMGSMVGGLYVSGYSPSEIRDLMLSTDMMDILNVAAASPETTLDAPFSDTFANGLTIGFGKDGIGKAPGLLGDQGILSMLSALLIKVEPVEKFDDLPIPFRCISTTDAVSGKAIVYDQGSLIRAIRSSISLPVVFSPFPQGDGSVAMDGGLVNNLPIDLAREMGADFVIAVDVSEHGASASDLKTISTVLMQTMHLVIKNNASVQYPDADIVLLPHVVGYGTLDFFKANELYEIGHQACIDHGDWFDKLADAYVSAGGELEPQDAERKGSYASLPSPVVKRVVIDNYSDITEAKELPTAELFNDLVGKQLDEMTVRELLSRLESMQLFYRLSSLSFIVGGEGDLHIIAQGVRTSPNRIAIGGYSSLTFSNNPTNHLTLNPELLLTVELKNLESKGFSFLEQVAFGNTNSVSSAVRYSFPIWDSRLSLSSTGQFKWGSLEPQTSVFNNDYTVRKDWGGTWDGSVRVDIFDTLLFVTGVKLDGNHSHRTDQWTTTWQGYAGAIWDNLRDSAFAWKGGSVEVLGRMGKLDGQLLYDIRFANKGRFEVVHHKISLGYSLFFSLAREPYQLSSSYTDWGGFNGMPGYAQGTFRRDIIMAGVSYQQKVASVYGIPIVLLLEAKVGACDSYDPYTETAPPPEGVFTDLSGFDVGFRASVGMKSSFGNLIIGVGYSIKNRFCFSVGVI